MEFASSPWVENGFHDFPFQDLQSWILKNTNVNDVILSSYEASFMVFSISGRKTFLFRMTHVSPFVNYNERSANVMIALYNNDSSRSLQILKEYHVKYIYVDETTSHDPLWVPVSYRGTSSLTEYPVKPSG